MIRFLLVAGLLGWVTGVCVAKENPPPPATLPALDLAEAMPRQELEAIDRQELGPLYTPQLAGRLLDIHVLIEKYFASQTAPQRQVAAKELEATGVDPNVIGRLVRVRLFWPKLDGGVYYINERFGPHAVMYFLGVPKEYDRTRSWPLVVKLPGVHAFITDPPPTADQVVQYYTAWMQDELKAHPDAIVVMPLLNLDELYGPSYPGMNSVIQPLLHVGGRANIDVRRVYLSGHGMAAHAVWNLALHYPTYFAAINPMAGSAPLPFQRLRVPNLHNVFSVVWHDADDKTIKVEMSRELVRLLRIRKCDVEYEETKLLGHKPSDEIVERLYKKMRARTRELYPPEVMVSSNRPDTLFGRNDWVQVYQQLSTGPEENLRLQYGTGRIRVYEQSCSVSAAITATNHIEAKTDNVESMRFYLNDRMLDLARPVTVIVNGKPRFEGMVKASVEEMLKDQLFLGRGWRYYTGIVDVELVAPATRPATGPATRKGITVIEK